MTWVAVAVAGAAVVGAVASNHAANKQADGVKKSIESTNALASQSRSDATSLFGTGQLAARNASQNVIDFYKATNTAPVNTLIQGNVLGQKALGEGYKQANNAILGLPVDMSFTNPQAVTADYTNINKGQLSPLLNNSQVDLQQTYAVPTAQQPTTAENFASLPNIDNGSKFRGRVL